MWRSLRFLILAAAALAAPAQAQSERVVRPVEWQLTNPVEGELDSPLLQPGPMAAGDSALILYDYGDARLKAFHLRTGALLWQAGRGGAGPGEFVNPTDLKLGPQGNVWVLDPPNLRISVFGPDGTFLRSIRVEEPLFRLGVVGQEQLLAIRSEPIGGLVVVVDSQGQVARVLPEPAWVADVPAMAAGVWTAADAATGTTALAFPYSGRLLLIRPPHSAVQAAGVVVVRPEPEQIVYSPRPRLVVRRLAPEAVMTVLSVALTPDEVWLLVNGETEKGNRIVDRYGREDGVYRGSWRLPVHVNRITSWGNRIVGIQTDFLPAVFVMTPAPERRSL